MRFGDKQLVAISHKEIFDLKFQHFTELDGNDQMMEKAEELGITREDIKLQQKKMSRT